MAVETDNPDLVAEIVAETLAIQQRLMTEMMVGAMAQMRREAERHIRAKIGGERRYLGKGTAQRRADRDAAIFRDHDSGRGLSVRALARKYRISKSQVQRALAAARGARATDDVV